MERSAAPEVPWAGVAAVDDARFPLGGQAGDPAVDGAPVWTRLEGAGSLTLRAAWWDGSAWQEVDPVDATPADGGYAHARLSGLPAGVPVAFQWVDDEGAGSPIAGFWTALPPDAAGVIRLGATSCTHQEHEAFPSLAAVAARGPLDAWAWLGDFAYFDDLPDREAFRRLWARNLGAPGIRDVLGTVAGVWSWDDHEFTNNLDPVVDTDKVTLGRAAFYESTPAPRDPAHPERMWRQVRLGAALELFVLDCRTERRRDEGLYLSAEQLAWLTAGLRSSTATWKIILNSVPFARLDGTLWDLPLAERDRWEGFPDQREAVLAGLDGVSGVAFLSGDIHCPVLARVEPTGPGAAVWDLIAGPGGSFLNPGWVQLVQQETVPWAAQAWNAVRIEAHTTGRLDVAWVGEDGASLAEAVLGDDGTLYELRVRDADSGDLVDGLAPGDTDG